MKHRKTPWTCRNAMSGLIDHAQTSWGISRNALLGASKCREVARPRQVLAWFAVREYGLSASSIARNTRRNHATIIHATRTIDRLIVDGDRDVIALIAAFRAQMPCSKPAPAIPNCIGARLVSVAFSHDDSAVFTDPVEIVMAEQPVARPRPAPVAPPVIRRTPSVLARIMNGPVVIEMPNRRAGR